MPEVIKQKVLQLEAVLGSYGACKFSHTFPVEKPFNYKPHDDETYVHDVVVESQTSVAGKHPISYCSSCLHENYINIKTINNIMTMIRAELEPYKSVFRRWWPTHLQGKTS